MSVRTDRARWRLGIVCREEKADMTRELLGELEHRVLLAMLHLGTEAYSVSVALHLEERIGHTVQLATIQVSLRRLEEKGLARSELRRASAEEGGRPRRYYEATEAGLAKLREARSELMALWRGTSLSEGAR